MKTGIMAATLIALALGGCTQTVGGPGASSYFDCGNGTRLKVDYLDGDRVMVQKVVGWSRGDIVVFRDTQGWLADPEQG